MKGTICITGKLNFGTRTEFSRFVETKGWVVVPRISYNLTYLITNNPYSGSKKNLQAQALGVTVITEEEFMDILNEDEGESVTNVQESKTNSTTTKKEDPFDFPYPINIVDSKIPDYANGTKTKVELNPELDSGVVLDTDAMKDSALKNPEVEQWLNMVQSMGLIGGSSGLTVKEDPQDIYEIAAPRDSGTSYCTPRNPPM